MEILSLQCCRSAQKRFPKREAYETLRRVIYYTNSRMFQDERLDTEVGSLQPVLGVHGLAAFLRAKSDLHLNLAPTVCERFAACLLAPMNPFGDWDGTDEGLPVAGSESFEGLFEQTDDEQELLALLRQLRRRPPELAGLILKRAAILKVLCDAYLIKRFKKTAQQDLAQGVVH